MLAAFIKGTEHATLEIVCVCVRVSWGGGGE